MAYQIRCSIDVRSVTLSRNQEVLNNTPDGANMLRAKCFHGNMACVLAVCNNSVCLCFLLLEIHII